VGKHTEKKLNKNQIFLNILIVIFLIAFIVSIAYICKWLLDNRKKKKITDKVSETIIEENENEETEYNI